MAEIGINLRADPSQFQAGTKAAQKAMDDFEQSAVDGADDIADKLAQVIRSLVKLGTESGKTRDDIVGDLRRFGLSAEQAERSIDAVWEEMGEGQKAARDVEKAADAFDDVEKNADTAADATKRVGDATEDTGSRFSTLGDIARDVLEGDMGGAAESAIGALGTLGAFAGAGGALAGMLAQGVGEMIGTWIGSWDDAAKASEERIATMYDDMIESGQRFLSESFIADAMGEIAKDTEKWAEALKVQEATGLSIQTVLRASVGDQEAIAAVVEATNAKRAEELAAIDRNAESTESYAAKVDAVNLKADTTISKFQTIGIETDTAAAKAAAVAAAFGTGNAALDLQIAKIQTIAAKVAGIGDKTIKINADTTGVEGALAGLQGRNITVNLQGQITRIGNQVW